MTAVAGSRRVVLGTNRYGKAEVRCVRVTKHNDRHELSDLNVTSLLSGDMADVHLSGDNAHILPTDTQKNTVYAFAREGVSDIEEFALRLARHFVDDTDPIHHARVAITEYPWARLDVDGRPHPYAFMRKGDYERTCLVHYEGGSASIISGITNLGVLKTTESEFWGYINDEYTTLAETHDRVFATLVTAQWRHTAEVDWATSYADAKRVLLETFAGHHSLSVQQTMYAMGQALIESQPEIAEVRLSLPNKHHFVVDLSPFGKDNDNLVFHADDRPYGLIEATVSREDAPADERAWE
jgi:urate oxidase